MDKPKPIKLLVVEHTEICERCLMIYVACDDARAFVEAECKTFGHLSSDAGPRNALLEALAGKQSDPAPATVYKLHVYPTYDFAQVEAWIAAWPHVNPQFEYAIKGEA